jgi:phosphomannomutase
MTKTVEAELGDSGRVLIRASGTEPLLRVMVDAVLSLSIHPPCPGKQPGPTPWGE